MSRSIFTPEELEELRRADAEIEAGFMITREEREAGNKRDRRFKIENSYGSEAAKRECYEANREKIAAAKREYYEANREKIAAAKREYYEANREKIAAAQREYYEANREKIAAAKREYYEANREKIAAARREYYEANREKIAAAKRTALRDYRKSIEFSQAELGARLGVSKQLISFWETGAVPINLFTVEAVLPELAEKIRRAAG